MQPSWTSVTPSPGALRPSNLDATMSTGPAAFSRWGGRSARGAVLTGNGRLRAFALRARRLRTLSPQGPALHYGVDRWNDDQIEQGRGDHAPDHRNGDALHHL